MAVSSKTEYAVSGKVKGAPKGSFLWVFDDDRGHTEPMASTAIAKNGSFRVGFIQQAAGGRSEGHPEAVLKLQLPDGTFLELGERHDFKAAGIHDFGRINVKPDDIRQFNDQRTSLDGEATGGPSATAGTMEEPTDNQANIEKKKPHGSTSRQPTAPRSPFYHGPFGRMFRKLPPWLPVGLNDIEKDEAIKKLAEKSFDTGNDEPEGDNKSIPAAYTYFGQFVDHDITFDPASSLEKQNDPNMLVNFRTPSFDLDNLYGEGPDDEPFMYDRNKPGRFLIGKGSSPNEDDLPRNLQKVALLGDKRNDENIIVAQMQLAWLKFHNAVFDRVSETHSGFAAFTEAQKQVRWHYQWIVLTDFLGRLCGQDLLKSIGFDLEAPDLTRVKRKFYNPKNDAFMPIEFSVAAYRLGHSMVRAKYDLNRVVTNVPIFTADPDAGPLTDLRGFRPLPGLWTLDWGFFLDLGRNEKQIQFSRKLNAALSRPLMHIQPEGRSLAELNLLRGFRMGLPSGQSVARAMGFEPLTNEQLSIDGNLAGHECPLWLYILKEAELQTDGAHMGEVGGTIIAEVFLGLADRDPNCFCNVDPTWKPGSDNVGRSALPTIGEKFELRDVIAIGGSGDSFP